MKPYYNTGIEQMILATTLFVIIIVIAVPIYIDYVENKVENKVETYESVTEGKGVYKEI